MALKMVLVPGWVEAALKSAKASGESLLKVGDLSGILSKQDVAFYIYLNMEARGTFMKPDSAHHYLIDSFDYFDLFTTMPEGTMDDWFRLIEKARLENMDISMQHLAAKSEFGMWNNGGEDPANATYLYEVFPIKEDVMGIRFNLEFIPSPDERHQKELACVDATIKRLSTYLSFEVISTLPIFSRYIQLASI